MFMFRQQKLVCVECLAPVDGVLRCPDCNFPICGVDCIATSDDDDAIIEHPLKWHRNYECRLLNKIGFRAADVVDVDVAKTGSASASEVPQLQVQVATAQLGPTWSV